MSLTKDFKFDNASNYVFDDTLIEVTGGVAQLIDVVGAYPITNPTLATANELQMSALLTFVETSTLTGADLVKYILSKDGVDYYWDTSAWVVSDGTFTQSNLASEITANIATFVTSATTVLLSKIFLHSDSGTTTPILSNVQLTYTFAAPVAETIHTTILYWNAKDTSGDAATDTVSIELVNDVITYGTNTVIYKETITVTPILGEYLVSLLDTPSMGLDRNGKEQMYKLTMGAKVYHINVPTVGSVNLFDLI